MTELEKAYYEWRGKIANEGYQTHLDVWQACYAAIMEFAESKMFLMPVYDSEVVALSDLESFGKEGGE